MKKLLVVLLLISLISCKTEKNNQKNTQTKKDNSILENKSQEKKIDKLLLNGVWGENIDQNALFFIENDSIYYINNQNNPFYIEIKNDSISVHYDNFIYDVKIIKLDKDSLIFKDNSSIIRLCRINK